MMMFVVPISLWLMISLFIYSLLWLGFIRRFGLLSISLFNLALSIILSPGWFASGHGVFPFPGGAAALLSAISDSPEAFPSLNLTLWMLTFLIFSVVSWFFKKKSKLAD